MHFQTIGLAQDRPVGGAMTQLPAAPALNALLSAGEWNTTEFKATRTVLPKSAFETVSAFANTHGGWLLLGVSQNGEQFEVSGVTEPDKLQNDLLSVLHADGEVNHDVEMAAYRYQHDGKVVLAFHIAENPRTRKPVYLDGDIRRTFIRKGGGDYRAQPQDIEQAGTGLRMMRREWQALGHAAPCYTNDRARKTFELFLPDVMSREVVGITPPAYDQVRGEVTGEVTGEVLRLLRVMRGEMSRQQIQALTGLKSEEHFRKAYLKPALAAQMIEMTLPQTPRSSKQCYRLTETGARLQISMAHQHKESDHE